MATTKGDSPDTIGPIEDAVRRICLALPEAVEVGPGALGSTFRIRRRTFAHLFTVTDPAGKAVTMLVMRADLDERHALLAIGHPFFGTRSGADTVGMVLEPGTDLTEVAELVTESYRLLAPKALAAQVDAPPSPA